jgi:hypothetical protein
VRNRALRQVVLMCVAALTLPSAALARTDTLTYSSAGEYQFVVPAWAGPSLQVVAVGGKGGAAAGGSPGLDGTGGHGAHVQGTLPITVGKTLYLEVGGNGTDCNGHVRSCAGGGGGASDVRTQPRSANLTPTDPRVLIAGGGGGGGRIGGAGGDAGMPGGATSGGAAGAPDGTGLGGGTDTACTSPGANGTLGSGGIGAYEFNFFAPGGDNGGGAGGDGEGFLGGGGGGGGLNGGGGGGGASEVGGCGNNPGGGGGGGSSRVPAGGSKSIDTTGQTMISISYADSRHTTSLSLSAPSSGTAGTAIAAPSVSSALSGGVSPGGTITWSVYGPSATAPTSCSGWAVVGTATVSANGTYHPSGGFTPITGAGNYWWLASYSGDNANTDVTSTCGAGMTETTVAAAQPSLSLSAPSSGAEGTLISPSSVSGALSGGPLTGGTVTFWVYGPAATAPTSCSGWQPVGTANVSGNGTYHPSGGFHPETGAGNYWWYASYSGDANDAGASSTCGAGMTETAVVAAQPSVSLSAPSSGALGTAISASSVSAALGGGDNPAGTITFTVFGPQASPPALCSSGGTPVGTATVSNNGTYHPSAAFTPNARGNYWWYASYGGDSHDAGAGSACGAGMAETTVPGVTTTLSLSAPSSGTKGSTIAASSVTAALSGGTGPGGMVTFTVFGPQASAPTSCSSGGTTVGTASVSDNGAHHPSAGFMPTASGNYWWYVSYSGDAINSPSFSGCGAAMLKTTVGTGSGGTGGSGSARLGAASVRGTMVTLPISCSAGRPCALQFKLIVVETIRGGKVIAVTARQRVRHRTVTIGQALVHVKAGGNARLALRLNRTGRALLKHHAPLHALLVVTLSGRQVAKKRVTIR